MICLPQQHLSALSQTSLSVGLRGWEVRSMQEETTGKLQVRHNGDLGKDGGRDDEKQFSFGFYVRERTNGVTDKMQKWGKEREND